MIFVTVGTHEQPFDRLLKYVDQMVENKKIEEEVIVQKGYSKYIMKNCREYEIISYNDMQKYIKEARIVITHGGPASFMMPISNGKIPIVVPRQKKYNEHVNNHQLDFAKKVEDRFGNIIVIEDIKDLDEAIANYNNYSHRKNDNNTIVFNNKLQEVISKMFEGEIKK